MSKKNFSKSHQRAILPGQLWNDIHGTVRVMSVAEGYAMVRRPHCMPFVISVRDMDGWRLSSAQETRVHPEDSCLIGGDCDHQWLIRKRGFYYRPNRAGYTSSAAEAGRYTEAEAKAEAAIEPAIMQAIPLSQAMDEVAHSCHCPAGPGRDCQLTVVECKQRSTNNAQHCNVCSTANR